MTYQLAGKLFLSTLSLRRATLGRVGAGLHMSNFYPRSPCGERQALGLPGWLRTLISIHALLAESDLCWTVSFSAGRISIHALLAESDINGLRHKCANFYFYPRSPCGERPASFEMRQPCDNFYPRSPCGERPGVSTTFPA